MPAKDKVHEAAKKALINDGWEITDDPLQIKAGGAKFSIDLAAEKMLVARKGRRRIAVEIKSFIGGSSITEFHLAVGQYGNYRRALRRAKVKIELYLAVPHDVFQEFFQIEFAQWTIEEDEIKLIIFDPDKEVITAWIN